MADFEVVFQENRDLIFRLLLQLTQNASQAEELAQETFFRAYMNFAALRDPQRVTPWLCRIARNTYFSWYREQKRLLPLEAAHLSACMDYTEELYMEQELREAAIAHLDTLGEPYREVFTLAVFGQLSLKEISKSFGKSESWARVTFYRAKQKIVEGMKKSYGL